MFNRRGTNLLSTETNGAGNLAGNSGPASATKVAKRADNSGPASGSPTGAQSFIGENLSIEGQAITIRCHGRLDVNGMMHADLHCHELHIGPSGHIVGVIKANSVQIEGRLEGGVAAQHVSLGKGAAVEGDIQSQFLAIEPGASFNGRSRKVKDAAQIKPELGPMNGTVQSPTALQPSDTPQSFNEPVAPSADATAASALPLPTPPHAPNGVDNHVDREPNAHALHPQAT